MKKIVPVDAHLVPPTAKKVFSGIIFDTYQWPQVMFDGTTETFEMLRRADTASVFPVKDNKLVVLKQLQPSWPAPKYSFPGGRVDTEDESMLSAIQRETQEETGLTFKNWRLIKVSQRDEKIEWFHYAFLATEPLTETNVKHDAGEQIEVIYMSFDEVKEHAKTEIRMGQSIIGKLNSLEELTNLPEFVGQEIDV